MTPSRNIEAPQLTLVANRPAPSHRTGGAIDPVEVLQALTASLELERVLRTLNGYLQQLVEPSAWEYRHAASDLCLGEGEPARHRLEYALTLNDEEIGTLKLMRGRRFTDAEQMRIESLLGLAAPALKNALLFHEVSRQLERDALTGLGNRRALDLQGTQWLADCVRHQHPLSMLVMDLDRFKVINDTYGHPFGDRLLRAVADAMRSVTRTADLAVRMGGDEFAILLPGTDLAAAMECGERVRQSVAAIRLATPDGETVAPLTSVGVATLRPGMTLEQLYHQADDALYAAKRAGCNRVLAGTCTADTSRAAAMRP